MLDALERLTKAATLLAGLSGLLDDIAKYLNAAAVCLFRVNGHVVRLRLSTVPDLMSTDTHLTPKDIRKPRNILSLDAAAAWRTGLGPGFARYTALLNAPIRLPNTQESALIALSAVPDPFNPEDLQGLKRFAGIAE